jgi:hypothetical protein
MKSNVSGRLSGLLLIFLLLGCQTKILTPGEGYIEVTGGRVWYSIGNT